MADCLGPLMVVRIKERSLIRRAIIERFHCIHIALWLLAAIHIALWLPVDTHIALWLPADTHIALWLPVATLYGS